MRTWIAGTALLLAVMVAQTAGAQGTLDEPMFDEDVQEATGMTTDDSALRGGKWETRLGVLFQDSTDVSFDGGTTADIDSEVGFRIGMSRHLSDHFELGLNLDWLKPDYDANLRGDALGEVFPASGDLEYTNVSLDVTYNILSDNFTPFLLGGAGWSWVDTNIATEPPETGCWWDPWWGLVCESFQNTRTIDGFTYEAGAGLRYDFNESYALSASYRKTWHDWDHADGKVDIDSYLLTLGLKF